MSGKDQIRQHFSIEPILPRDVFKWRRIGYLLALIRHDDVARRASRLRNAPTVVGIGGERTRCTKLG
jgi:hypothetical protein